MSLSSGIHTCNRRRAASVFLVLILFLPPVFASISSLLTKKEQLEAEREAGVKRADEKRRKDRVSKMIKKCSSNLTKNSCTTQDWDDIDAFRYKKYAAGTRPPFVPELMVLYSKREEWVKALIGDESATLLMSPNEIEKSWKRIISLGNIIDFDLFDLEDLDGLTPRDMEFLLMDYNNLGGLISDAKNRADDPFWKRNQKLYPFICSISRNWMEGGGEHETIFFMQKINRLHELAVEKVREGRKITVLGEYKNSSGSTEAQSVSESDDDEETEMRRKDDGGKEEDGDGEIDYRMTAEYQAKVEEHRKKTREQLFDEVRVILRKNGVDVENDVPGYLWTLPRYPVLKEVDYYLNRGEGLWSERLVLEVFYDSIIGSNKNSVPPLQGWLDDDVHHCDWEGITCGLTTVGEGIGSGVPRLHPYCYSDNCAENGDRSKCPVGLFGPTDSHAQKYLDNNEFTYCPAPRLDPLEDHVTKIDLMGLKLQGTLTPYLPHLKFLHRLNLFDNEIAGYVPSSYGSFYNIHFIDLGKNQITGNIPTELGELENTLVEVWLESNQLSGTLPENVGALHLLKYFDVSNNRLTGTIGEHIHKKLISIVEFRANDNALSGTIPPIWPYPLEILDLSSNKLHGQISFQHAERMRDLYLNSNLLTGTLPEEMFGFRDLRALKIGDNKFCGSLPSGLGNLGSLEEFWGEQNKITGTIPTEVGNMAKLVIFSMSYNKLSGSIPSELGGIMPMVEFNISANALTGTVPSSVCGETRTDLWSRLWTACDSIACPPGYFHPDGASNYFGSCVKCFDHLSNDKNDSIGLAPPHQRLGQTTCKSVTYAIGDLNGDGEVYEHEALRLLWLSTHGLNWGDRFDSWDERKGTKKCKLTGVTCNKQGDVVKLDLKGANLCFDGSGGAMMEGVCFGIPSEIGVMENLEVLDFSSNEYFSGTIPDEIASLERLKVFEMSRCPRVTGTLPAALGRLKNLRTLDLSESNWSGQLPSGITQLESLEKLNLGLNPRLSGPLPDNIGDLHNIKELLLSRMNLSSTLPSSLGNLTRLENLELYGNRFEGQIPNLSKNKQLRRIDVFNNDISGTFPWSLANLPMLQIVHLKNNRIEGTLPSELGSLNMLSWLDVSLNQLTGTIPESFTNLQDLRDLRLGRNKLYDPVPEGLCSSTKINGGLANHCGCDAIICPMMSYSPTGYATTKEGCTKCAEGEGTLYIGSTACKHFTQRDMLSLYFDAVGGAEWWPVERTRGWKDENLSECEWEGVTCDKNGEVNGLAVPQPNPRGIHRNDGWAELHASRTVHYSEDEPKIDLTGRRTPTDEEQEEIDRILGRTFEDLKAEAEAYYDRVEKASRK